MTALIIDLLLFCAATFFLLKATQLLIQSLNSLARTTKVGAFALAGIFSAVATSLPELVVAISSSVAGASAVALGVALGSNLLDITIVIGIVAVFGGGLGVVADFVRKDMAKAFMVLLLPFALLLDGRLSRSDGLILLVTFVFYHYTVFRAQAKYSHDLTPKPWRWLGHWLHLFSRRQTQHQVGWLALGAVMLIFSADIMVQSGLRLAGLWGIAPLFFGLLLVPLGTCLPELSFELRAIRSGKVGLVFGDLLGSLVANLTLIVGIAALLNPIQITGFYQPVLTAFSMFLAAFLLLWYFIQTKYKLSRWEGAVMLGVYAIFSVLQLTSL